MIDNFDQIKEMLEFDSPDDFYFIQIMKRKKDPGNENINRAAKVVDHFYISSKEDLDKYKFVIVDMCTKNNARAYIHVTRRDAEKVSLGLLSQVAMYISKKEYRKIRKVYPKVCGCTPGKQKRWILDVDDVNQESEVSDFLTGKGIEFHRIPTPNGAHFVVHPFDSREFSKQFPNVDKHKDNPTVLYYG